MIDKLTDWLIERRKKQLHIPIVVGSTSSESEFKRVLNTIRNNKIMVQTKDDGIYIRMAGDESKGECFSTDFAKVKSFDKRECRYIEVTGAVATRLKQRHGFKGRKGIRVFYFFGWGAE